MLLCTREPNSGQHQRRQMYSKLQMDACFRYIDQQNVRRKQGTGSMGASSRGLKLQLARSSSRHLWQVIGGWVGPRSRQPNACFCPRLSSKFNKVRLRNGTLLHLLVAWFGEDQKTYRVTLAPGNLEELCAALACAFQLLFDS